MSAQPQGVPQQVGGALEPLPAGPVVAKRVVEGKSSGNAVVGVGIGAVAGACVAGPIGMVVGGCIGAALGSSAKSKQVTATEIFPYGIQTVRLPFDGIKERDGIQYYAIDITPVRGNAWRVMRRYNDFDNLRTRLMDANRMTKSVGSFPRKRFHKLRDAELDGRRKELEQWLQEQIKFSQRINTTVGLLRPFLERCRGPVPAHSQASNPQAGQPQMPMQADQLNSRCAPVLKVIVPAGVTPGQTMSVLGPDGQTLMVVVPEGATPGTELQVSVPSPAPGAPSSAMPSSQPPPTQAASSDQAQPSPNMAASERGEVFTIEVPPNTTAGQSIGVEVNGQVLTMTLPDGSKGGDALTVWYDPSSNCVTAIPDSAGPASATQLLSVQVPPGVAPGGQFAVLCPDGRQLPVELPLGAEAATELQVKFDARAGTLVVAQ